jgi:hypothetical protein
LADLTDFLEEFFKPPVIGDGLCEEGSLRLWQGGEYRKKMAKAMLPRWEAKLPARLELPNAV